MKCYVGAVGLAHKLKIAGIGIVAVAALGAACFYGYMQLVKAGYVKYNKYDKRSRGELQVGSQTPDLPIMMYDGSKGRLSDLWKRPVLLVFGSCT
jgi:hypothetical protein